MATAAFLSQLNFSFYRHQPILADFSGGQITSDAGLLPLRAFDQRHGLTRELAQHLRDPRQGGRVRHSSLALVRQRVYQIVAGYEDANDAYRLRHDPVFGTARRSAPGSTSECFLANAFRLLLHTFAYNLGIADGTISHHVTEAMHKANVTKRVLLATRYVLEKQPDGSCDLSLNIGPLPASWAALPQPRSLYLEISSADRTGPNLGFVEESAHPSP